MTGSWEQDSGGVGFDAPRASDAAGFVSVGGCGYRQVSAGQWRAGGFRDVNKEGGHR